MTVTFGASGTLTASSNSNVSTIAIPYPAGISAGDILVLWLGQKPNNVTTGGSCTTPSGWTAIDSQIGGGDYTGVPASDTGNMNLFAFYKIADGTESGSLTVTLGTNHIALGSIIRLSRDAAATLDVVSAKGTRTTAPTSSWSVAMGASLDLAPDDFLLGFLSVPTDTGTIANWTAQNITATGITFSGEAFGSAETTTGFDMRASYRRAVVASGSGSVAPSMSQTWTGTLTNFRGPYMVVRFRDVAPPSSMVADVGMVAI